MEECKTSAEWLKQREGLHILDPDGWRDLEDPDYFWNNVKISEAEFNKRLMISTCMVLFEEEDKE